MIKTVEFAVNENQAERFMVGRLFLENRCREEILSVTCVALQSMRLFGIKRSESELACCVA